MSNISYRPEIDGLRAVAVMAVVLYHLKLGFTGGYVGVDVFFVISGFLITSIIFRDIQTGSFSLSGFWVRRIRRILPAVSFMIIIVFITAYYLLEPATFKELSAVIIANSFIASNIELLKTVNYYRELAVYSPLLHTWSLAVEEQFYLIFPILLLLVYRSFKNYVFIVFLSVFFVSLLWCVYEINENKEAAFYLLYSRAWELLLGSLIALIRNKFSLSNKTAEVVSFMGLVMIFSAIFIYDDKTVYPGINALLPVFGAGMFIAGCKDERTLAGRLLSIRPMVFIGIISYSLYLWHWPIWSFINHVFIEIDLMKKLLVITASLLIAFLSWKFIEEPFRRGRLLPKESSAFIFAGIIFILLTIPSLMVFLRSGMPNRYSEDSRILAEDIHWNGMQANAEQNSYPPYYVGDAKKSSPDFILWGDSHAAVTTEVVDKIAKEYGLMGEMFVEPNLIPVPNLWSPEMSDVRRDKDIKRNKDYIQSIVSRRIPDLILVARWRLYCESYFVTDNDISDMAPLTSDISAASISRQLKKMVDDLSAAGVRIWFFEQIPETDTENNARKFYQSVRFPALNKLKPHSIRRQDYEDSRKCVDRLIDGIDPAKMLKVDVAPQFFKDRNSFEVYSDRSYYKDSDHLTQYGADHFLTPVFEGIFAKIEGKK